MLTGKVLQPQKTSAPVNKSGGISHTAIPVIQKKGNSTSVQAKVAPQTSGAQPLPANLQSKSAVPAFGVTQANHTGMPDNLKHGVEHLSGVAMDDVKVHYNSPHPAKLHAHAYAQGSNIHIAPGQEKHLSHEAWHVAQQKQGRVKPTIQKKGVAINNDSHLEKEATVMGNKAALMQLKQHDYVKPANIKPSHAIHQLIAITQLDEKDAGGLTAGMGWKLIYAVLAKEWDNKSLSAVIQPLLKAGDLLITYHAKSYLDLKGWIPGINLLITAIKASMTVWDAIPDNVKTGLLYVTGMVAANAPILSRYQSVQDLVIKSDQGEVRESLQKWAQKASVLTDYLTMPVTTLYNWLTGGGNEQHTLKEGSQAKAETPAKQEKEGADYLTNIDWHILKLKVKNLKLGNKQKDAKDKDPGHTGGLIVNFFVQANLFGHKFPERGGDKLDELFLPFKGEFSYEAGSPFVLLANEHEISGLTIGPINVSPLKAGKNGLQEAGLNFDKIKIGDAIIITNASGKVSGTNFNLKATLSFNIAGEKLEGGVSFTLDDGKFKQLSIKNLTTGNYELKELTVDSGYSGKADFVLKKFNIFNGTISAQNVNVNGEIANKQLQKFAFKADKFNLDFWGGDLNINEPHLEYKGKTADDIENITGGAKSIIGNFGKGVNINLEELEFDKKAAIYKLKGGKISFADFEIIVSDAKLEEGKIEITAAKFNMPAYSIDASVSNISLNKDGVDFKELNININKQLSPIDGVTFNNSKIGVTKKDEVILKLTTDVSVKPGDTEMVGAKQVEFVISKDSITGTIAKLDINTAIFSIDVKDAVLSKDKLGAQKADIKILSTDGDESSFKSLPNFDTGLLQYLPANIGFEIEDIYFIKGQGFKIGKFSPVIDAIEINILGAKATINPKERMVALKASLHLPKNIPGIWPFSLDVPFPVFLGISGAFGFKADGGVDLSLDTEAKREAGKNKPYKFVATPAINGSMSLKIFAGIEFGNRFLVALQANLFAQTELAFNTQAQLSGSGLYADKKWETEALKICYELKSKVTAAIGGEIRGKAFLVFDKTLASIKFKEWTLGEWGKKGSLTNNKGELDESGEKWKFDNKPVSPDVEHKILEGDEARKLLLSASTNIPGSGPERERILKELTLEIKGNADRLLEKYTAKSNETLKQRRKLDTFIDQKDVIFRENVQHEDIAKILEEFDTKFELESIRDHIRANTDELEQYKAELHKILAIINNVEGQLIPANLEKGTGEMHKNITAETQKVKTVESGIDSVNTSANVNYDEAQKELDKLHSRNTGVNAPNGIMTCDKFIEISTTKGIFSENERKTIKPVDDALRAYDNTRGTTEEKEKSTLIVLNAAINKYLTESTSGRVTSVKILQFEVKERLAQLGKNKR